MVTLTPVDGDPFASQGAAAGPTLTPVDYDPFAAGKSDAQPGGFWNWLRGGAEAAVAPLVGAVQHTSPVISSDRQPLGELRQADSGPVFQDPNGQWNSFDSSQHIVMPQDGKTMVYARTPESDTGALANLGHVLGLGMMAPASSSFAAAEKAVPAVTGKGILAPLTGEGRMDAAGNVLNELAQGQRLTPEAAPLPGMKLTTGQATNNSGVLWLERSLEQGSAAGKDAADTSRTANNQAISRAIGSIGDADNANAPAVMRDALATATPEGTASDRVLGDLQSTLGASGDIHDQTQALMAARSQNAAPLYEKAFAAAPVHDDRIAQFVQDPIVQQGINKGLQIQRLESLAQNKPFNPSDFAVTGFDEAGNAILGKVPNMRLLDAGKRGLDNIVEQYRSPVTGKLQLDQYGNAVNQVRAALVNHLDTLNPDYAAARQAWSGPSQSMDAITAGRNILKPDTELTAQRIANMSEGDKQFFRAGVVRAAQDAMASSQDGNGVQAVTKLFSKPGIRTKIAAAFPDQDSFAQFMGRTSGEMSADPLISRVLKTDATGAYTFPASDVADQFIKPLSSSGAPEAWSKFRFAMQNASPEIQQQAMGAARDSFAQKFRQSVQSVMQDQEGARVILPGKVTKFTDDYSHIINSPLFTQDQRDLISSIEKAGQMAARTARGGAPGGSDTYAKLAGAKFIDAITGKLPARLITLASGAAGGAAGHLLGEPGAGAAFGLHQGPAIANKIYGSSRDAVLNLVQRSISDPDLATALQSRVLDASPKGSWAQSYIANVLSQGAGAVAQGVRGLAPLAGPVAAHAGSDSQSTGNN